MESVHLHQVLQIHRKIYDRAVVPRFRPRDRSVLEQTSLQMIVYVRIDRVDERPVQAESELQSRTFLWSGKSQVHNLVFLSSRFSQGESDSDRLRRRKFEAFSADEPTTRYVAATNGDHKYQTTRTMGAFTCQT